MSDRRRDDTEERLLELGLEELLGGAPPPDVSGRVEKALAGQPEPVAKIEPVPMPSVGAEPVLDRSSLWLGGVCSAAAALLVAALLGVFSASAPSAVEVTVRSGGVALLQNGAWSEQPPAGRAGFWLNVGDQLRARDGDTSLQLGSLGWLSMSEFSRIEVIDMEWHDFGKGAALGGVTVAVIAGGVQWLSGDVSSEAQAGDRLTLTRGADPAVSGMEAGEVTELRDALAQERARVAQLESALSRKAVTTPEDPEEPGAGDSVEVMEVPFHYTGLDEVLARVDWAVMGSATNELVPILAELAAALDRGEDPPLDLAGKIQSLNGKFLEQANTIKDGIPGEGVNGPFTHPLFVANQLHATFQFAGLPLSEDQTGRMQSLAALYAGEDDQRRASYSTETPMLQVLMEEMALKERFYAEARGVLNSEQLGVISNPAIDGYTGIELIGTGVAWASFTKPARLESLEAYGTKLSQQMSRGLKMSAEHEAQVGAIIQKWAARYPQHLWEAESPKRARAGMIEVERVREAAQMQLGFVQEILNSVSLSPQQRQELLELKKVFVPMRR